MKQIIKKFNNLVEKTLFKLENKTTIFKLKNKTNKEFIISNFNKYLITCISLLFFYLFYLLTPLLYDKVWVQNRIESKFLNEFKINLSSSADISYRILPAPHYLIRNSKLLLGDNKNQKSIADVKNLKIFIDQRNFFDKEKINLKKAIINNANFSLTGSDIKILNEFSNNQFANKKIKINKSNIFFKNNLGEIITIIKINKAIFFFDDKKLLNLFTLKGNMFAVPFVFDLENKIGSIKNKKINFKAKSLKLNILNESIIENNNSNTGKNIISFLTSIAKTKYNIKKNLITLESVNSTLVNSKIDYSGKMSINPFDLDLNIDLGNHKISKLFNMNSILIELFKSELLFNNNISVKTSITANTNINSEIFQKAKINFNIINGKIDFDRTKLTNNKIGSLSLSKSNLFFEDNNLILNTNISIDIKNSDLLFSFLNTKKSSRKNINNILINLDYNFLNHEIKFKDVKIDSKKVSNAFLTTIDSFDDNSTNNLIKNRRFINKLFDIYEG